MIDEFDLETNAAWTVRVKPPVFRRRKKGTRSMRCYRFPVAGWVLVVVALFGMPVLSWSGAAQRVPSDSEVSRELEKEQNQAIVESFLKYELSEVNKYATKPLLSTRPSLEFFMKQAQRKPLESLFFLEQQVHRLRDAQKKIDSLPYSLAFSSAEKKKILGLKPVADRIVSYGIPLMKRDFHLVLQAIKELADKRRKHPMELIPDPAFRDEVYRRCTPDPKRLDREMGELSYGEKVCIHLGWVLEQVTITRLWLVFNDNKLPRPEDYKVFRKKRSEYWKRRLARIYKDRSAEPARAHKQR